MIISSRVSFVFSGEYWSKQLERLRYHNLWRSRNLRVFVASICLLAAARPVAGITFDLNYVAGASNPNDPNGAGLMSIVQEAADRWADIIEDSHTMKLNVSYYVNDSMGNGPCGMNTTTACAPWLSDNAAGDRVVEGNILFFVNPHWYIDPTPEDDSEFTFTQTLYQDLTQPAQDAGYSGSDIETLLEVGFRGANNFTDPDVANAADMLSTAFHEIGHHLGMTGIPAAINETADNDYDLPPSLLRGANMAVEALQPINVHFVDSFPLMGSQVLVGGIRRLPAAADVFAAAAVGNWTQIDLQRQDFIATGGSNNWIAANWMGNQKPGTADDAFIRSQDFNPTVELVGTAYARNLFIGDGDNLSTNAFKLDVGRIATIDGTSTNVFVDTGGELEANRIVVQNGASLLAYGGLVDALQLFVDDGSFLFGNAGTVAIGQIVVNDGVIHSNGGTFLVGGLGTHWDLDGYNDNGVLSAASGNLLFQLPSPLADDFNGTIQVGQGHWMESSQPFRLASGATVQMNGGSTTGNKAELYVNLTLASSTAKINVDGIAHFQSPFEMIDGSVNLTSGATLELNGTSVISGGIFSTTGSGRVRLNGTTNYAGGEYRGGTLYQNGTANVLTDTTLGTNFIAYPPVVAGPPVTLHWLALYDWDGTGLAGKVTNISPGATFTINAEKIDGSPNADGYDGTVNVIGGALIVNTGTRLYNPISIGSGAVPVAPTPWRLDGTMNLYESGGNTAVVTTHYGSPMHIYGEVNVFNGDAIITGMTPMLTAGGQINVGFNSSLVVNNGIVAEGTIDVQSTGLIQINGGTLAPLVQMNINGLVELNANTLIQGGTWNGFGTLRQLGNANFDQTTRLGVQTEFAASGSNTIATGQEIQLTNGGLVEAGATFSGDGALNNFYLSQLTLADGADVGVSLINAGLLEIGASPGLATVDHFTQTFKGTLAIELAGATVGDFDQLAVDGIASLGGNLSVDLLSSFVPDPSDSFTILTSLAPLTLNGSFVNVANGGRLDTSDGIGSFKVSYGYRTGTVRLSSFRLTFSADFDADGDVDRNDFARWETSFGIDGMADADGDGDSDGLDFLAWQQQYGSGVSGGAVAAAAVPEPTSLVLSLLAFAFLTTNNRFRDRRAFIELNN